jgi:hypothetical protein
MNNADFPAKEVIVKSTVYDEIKQAKLVEYGVEVNYTVSVYEGDGDIITENNEDE